MVVNVVATELSWFDQMSELSLDEMRKSVPALLRKIIKYKPKYELCPSSLLSRLSR